MSYGTEFIIDLYGCSTEKFNREGLTQYLEELCNLIDMERCDLHFWDYEAEEYDKAPEHLKGTTVVQFIKTSNITIHTLDKLKKVYLNIFSCKEFDTKVVADFCIKHFRGYVEKITKIDRV